MSFLFWVALSLAADSQSVRYALMSEPAELDSRRTTDSYSQFVLGHTMEGLVRYSIDGSAVPAVAKSWKIEKTRAVFFLREDAVWSDGVPVRAQDFVFAWRSALTPETAAPYASFFYSIVGAEKIAKGQAKPETLGVRAVDDHTLEVTFSRPAPEFLSRLALPLFLPIREDFYKLNLGKYASGAGKILSDGPFILSQWNHGVSLLMVKNPRYWNAPSVKLAQIEVPYIAVDDHAKFNFFKGGKLDILTPIRRDDLSEAVKEHFKIQSFADSGVWFLEFNCRPSSPMHDRELRHAIALALGCRGEYLAKIIGIPGAKVASGLVPSTLGGFKPVEAEYNPALAKSLVDRYKKLHGPLILHFLTTEGALALQEAQYFAEKLKGVGIELRIDRQIFKQRLAKMRAGDFDLAETNWLADYPDPMTFLEIKTSWSGANRGAWFDSNYDDLIHQAQVSLVPRKRKLLMEKAQALLLDDFAVYPLYESNILWSQNPKLRGVVRRTFGPDPDFTQAYFKP